MDHHLEMRLSRLRALTRRHFLRQAPAGLGGLALASLLDRDHDRAARAAAPPRPGAELPAPENPLSPRPPHFAPKAKSVIYLHMSGGPPQQDLFDYKPKLAELHMQPCPDEFLKNQRFAFIKGHPNHMASDDRLFGYRRALDRAGSGLRRGAARAPLRGPSR